MTRSRLRPLFLVVAAITVLGACAPAPATAPSAATGAPPTAGSSSALPSGASAFDAVRALMGPAGEVSPDMALQAFALAIAPLPGVTPPSGTLERLDADAALAWVWQVWDELAADQRAAIERALAALPDPYTDGDGTAAAGTISLAAWRPVTATAGHECGKFVADPGEPPSDIPSAVAPYVDMMRDAAGSIAGHLGRPALPRLAVCLVSDGSLAAPAMALVFDAEHAHVGVPASCTIALTADGLEAVDDSDLGYLIAFETFVCFEATVKPGETMTTRRARLLPHWVKSGSAAWAGATVAEELFGGVGPGVEANWANYLTTPHLSLLGRGSDAIGFFAQVDQDLPSAWDVLDAALAESGNAGPFDALTGRRQSFIDLWAAGYFRDASRGPDWDIVGPGIPGDTSEAGSIEIENGGSEEMAAPAMAVATADLSTSADITSFASNHLRIHDGVQDLKNVRNQAYCTSDGGSCACPKGSPGATRPPLPPLAAEAKLAVTGMEWGATAEIRGLSLEEYCGPEPSADDSAVWSMVLWAPDLDDTYPPILAAYTCDGLESTWQAIYLPSIDGLTRTFEMDFEAGPVSHLDLHRDIPAAGHSPAIVLDYAIDFELDQTADAPVIKVTGTKTEAAQGRTYVFPPREFGSDAPLVLRNVSLETQLEPYPQYQHPFRTQALEECGG